MKVKVLVYDCQTKELREEEQEIEPIIIIEDNQENNSIVSHIKNLLKHLI